ncbi:MAG: VWA domain-containing protein [Actinomycetota bacterium]|nr:VWA domain-containing protein [Actinomycetota bacterium]
MNALHRADLADVAARFATLLHAAGIPVTPERAGRFASAVALASPAVVPELYWLARVTLVTDHAHIAVFDRVFAQVFEGLVDPAEFRGGAPSPPAPARGDTRPPHPGAPSRAGSLPSPSASLVDPGPSRRDDRLEQESLTAALSPEERLRHQDFATLTPEELAVLEELGERLSFAPPPRASRRKTRDRRGRELDVRATLRRARRTGGEPMVAVRRRRRQRPRRVVLICDISGSMEPYTRAYLQLLMSSVSSVKAEAFTFATRLTRLTRTLQGTNPNALLARAGQIVPDWSGGTRIGEAIRAFNDRYGRRGLARGAVILILSDGWETGDPQVLAREMERLRRLAFRIVWVNPRKAALGYEPLAGGMAAALPHVDAFVSGHSLSALDDVLEAIADARGSSG